ncbi:polysaccharide deacetylase family protein [Pontibacter actiniarum]|nr:polysaccharide deacetylase family protein [Pontibacter actiniarum]
MHGRFMLSVYFHKPSKREFEACVKWLKKNGFTFISTSDLENIIQHELELPKGAILLTVDDGWQTNEANIVEVVNKYHVPVTIFISSEPVEEGAYWWSYVTKAQQLPLQAPSKHALKQLQNEARLSIVRDLRAKITLPREAMTVEQVKRITASGYVTVGGHTHTHPILINCEDEVVYEELRISKQKLESWTGAKVNSFAYPNGNYGSREIKALQDLEYRLAFSSDPLYITREKLKDRYEIPRFGLLEGASMAENICRMVGVWQTVLHKLRLPSSRKPTEKDRQNQVQSGETPPLLSNVESPLVTPG